MSIENVSVVWRSNLNITWSRHQEDYFRAAVEYYPEAYEAETIEFAAVARSQNKAVAFALRDLADFLIKGTQ